MHELSIVRSIVEAAQEQTRAHQAKGVEEITLLIGNLSGVDYHALEFAWELGVKDSVLEHARYQIEKTVGQGTCADCGHKFEIKERYDACPQCENYFIHISGGDELKIKSLVLLD